MLILFLHRQSAADAKVSSEFAAECDVVTSCHEPACWGDSHTNWTPAIWAECIFGLIDPSEMHWAKFRVQHWLVDQQTAAEFKDKNQTLWAS